MIGVVPTSAVSYFTRIMGAGMGCVITASHNPARYNGLKLFSGNGLKLDDVTESRIEDMVLSDSSAYTGPVTGKQTEDVSGKFTDFLAGSMDCDLTGMRIVLDTANGSYSLFGGSVLGKLGAEVKTVFNSPDGTNINDGCGATDISDISRTVPEGGFDAGIAMDGDGDRVIMIDELGNKVDGDNIMGLCALHMMERDELKGNTIVATEYSNIGLDISMKGSGINIVRVKNGDRYVVEEMLKNGYNLGGEFSGHIIFMDKLNTGDGMLSALQVLSVMKNSGKKLSELAACVRKYPQVIVNVEVGEKRDINLMQGVKQKITETEEKLRERGRLLVRYSGTENVFRIMIEGEDAGEISALAESIAQEVRKEIGRS